MDTHMSELRPIVFWGDSLDSLRRFPEIARRRVGHQLDMVQRGYEPNDWKPMNSVGAGVREIRVRDEHGTFRVIYVTKFGDTVFVLHCFQKKTHSKDEHRRPGDGDAEIQGTSKGALTMSTRFASVWDAIEDTPALAENMRLRSSLMIALKEHITQEGLSQSQAAKKFGVTQPRISDLIRGRIDLFAIDTLVNMLATAGMHVELHIGKAA
jgi:predicted XRE-type DNA-binding protein/phage-related protein